MSVDDVTARSASTDTDSISLHVKLSSLQSHHPFAASCEQGIPA
jgi:hypothetical protein